MIKGYAGRVLEVDLTGRQAAIAQALVLRAARLRIGRVVEDPVVVLGELRIALGQDAVARHGRVARQRRVLLVDLMRIAADPNVGSLAVEGLRPQGHVLLAMRPAARPAPRVALVSHRSIRACERQNSLSVQKTAESLRQGNRDSRF